MATLPAITVPNAKAEDLYLAAKRRFGDSRENPTTQQKIDFVHDVQLKFLRDLYNNYMNDMARAAVPVVNDDTVAQ